MIDGSEIAISRAENELADFIERLMLCCESII